MDTKKHIHGFKTPDSYFSSLEDRIMDKLKEETLPKGHGMRAPEAYFDSLEDRILSKVGKKEKKRIGVVHYLWPVASIAAATLAFILWIGSNKAMEPTQILVESNNNIELIDYYLDELLEDMPDASLYEFADTPITNWSFEDFIDHKEIEEYLMEHMDLSTLLSYE